MPTALDVESTVAYFYAPETLRLAILEEIRDGHPGSLAQKLLSLGIRSSAYHQMRQRQLGILTVLLDRLHLLRVCEGQQTIGYMSLEPIDLSAIWSSHAV